MFTAYMLTKMQGSQMLDHSYEKNAVGIDYYLSPNQNLTIECVDGNVYTSIRRMLQVSRMFQDLNNDTRDDRSLPLVDKITCPFEKRVVCYSLIIIDSWFDDGLWSVVWSELLENLKKNEFVEWCDFWNIEPAYRNCNDVFEE
jgi:hypothetical protein